jgi:site-specific DNA recombinase
MATPNQFGHTVWMAKPTSSRCPHGKVEISLALVPRLISIEKAQNRTRVAQSNDKRLKSGGKPRYLLSGLLTCSVCGAHYILADARSYSCSGHSQGGACSNRIRVRRTKIESIILDPIHKELLEPQRVTRMAEEMEATCAERIKAATKRAAGAPDELVALDNRIARLRERSRTGDPDMTTDELQAAIERAEAKRRELQVAPSFAKHRAQILSVLPKAAELYKQQISLGLSGDREAVAKARPLLRELLGGEFGSLQARAAACGPSTVFTWQPS